MAVDTVEEQPYGWIPDEQALESCTEGQPWYGAVQDQVELLIKNDTDEDVFHYRSFMKHVSPRMLREGRLLSRNQGSVGSCVGVATGRLISELAAYDIEVRNQAESYIDEVSGEWCYYIGRKENGMIGRGDGSTNGGQLRGLEKHGVVFERPYPSVDLSDYSVSRCRAFGAGRVPDGLHAEAAKHKLLKAFRVRSVDQWWTLVGAGYPVNLCSSWGGSGSRDSEGYMRRSGRWAHSMGNSSRRKHRSRGRSFLVQNSWGSGWARQGALFPNDMPYGSFWIDEGEAEWIVRTGEVIAYADFQGGFELPYEWGKGHKKEPTDKIPSWGDL